MRRSQWFGFNPPFLTESGRVMPLQLDERLIKNDLLQLLLTSPGERVMRPSLGTPIRTSVFDQSDQSQEDLLRGAILTQIERFEERVIVSELVFERDPDNNMLTIKLYGFVVSDEGIRTRFEIELDTPVEILQ